MHPAAPCDRPTGSRQLARGLLWLTALWNMVEGAVGMTAGVRSGSIALVGFGLDSFIEVFAAAILLWRLGVSDARAERRERAARRLVGATFVLLAAYVLAESAYVLLTGSRPEASRLGALLAVASLLLMPALGLLKRWNARRLGSPALVAESTETLVCSYLSATLLAGLMLNAIFGWWWADVAAALAMLWWILREGVEGLRAEETAAPATSPAAG